MRPGISIQHTSLPAHTMGVVRCDVTALIGFIPKGRWPEEAAAGDLISLRVRRYQEIEEHERRPLLDPATCRAARSFFENGGDVLYVYAVCIESPDDLLAPSDSEGVLLPLFDQLRTEEEIALIAIPSAAWMRCTMGAPVSGPGGAGGERWRESGTVQSEADALYRLMMRHCRQMINRFLVIDAPRGLHSSLLERWFDGLRAGDPATAAYGAVYYPWLKRGDDLFPPSGAVLGLYARMEREHGMFGVGWPPANAPLRGVTHTEVELDWAEAGAISDIGMNPVVIQPGRGTVVFGARTMSTDPAWSFINSRRIVSMITEQLRRDNEWAVFEPNSRSLWKTVERDVLVRLDQFFEAGILSGTRSQEEYSVQCNEATNPIAMRDAGQLNVRVSLRPVGTTERILIDLRLGSNGP